MSSSKSRRIIELEQICGRLRDEVNELREQLSSRDSFSWEPITDFDGPIMSLVDLRRKIDRQNNAYWDFSNV